MPSTGPTVISKLTYQEMLERGRKFPHFFAKDFLGVECHVGQIQWLNRASWDETTQSYRVLKPNAKEGVLAASNRWGKMLPLGSRLIGASTDNAPLTMGTVRVGDRVYGLDGKPYRVTWVGPVQISTDAYTVCFSDGSCIVANAEHLWAVETTAARKAARTLGTAPVQQVMTTLEVQRNLTSNAAGVANLSIPVCAPVDYPEQDVPLDPYLLGVWLGDGHANTGKYTAKDTEIADELRRRGFVVHARQPKDRCTEWRVEGLATTLRGMGLLHNKRVPAAYLVGSVSQRLDLVRGLMDTDGYAEPGGRCEFVTTSQALAEAMRELLESLGQVVCLHTGTATLKGKDCGPKYRITWSPTLEVFYLPRKLAKQRESLGHVSERRCRRYITAVEPAPPQAMRCIAVDAPDRLYLTDHYIATHNTFIEAVKHLHRAFYQIRPEDYARDPATGLIRDYRTVNIAMSLDQALLAFNYAQAMATSSKIFKRFVIDQKGTPFPKLMLGVDTGREENRWHSEIWARSTAMRAKFLLGHNFNYIAWDEAAFDHAITQDDVLDGVIRMRLADQSGDLDLISSPNGYNAFQRIWAEGQNLSEMDLYSMSGAIWQNVHPQTGKPNIDFALVKKNMRRMHPDWILQNIQGLFAKLNNVFPVDAVMACYADQDYRYRGHHQSLSGMYLPPDYDLETVTEVVDGLPTTRLKPVQRQRPARYVIGADLARKKDFTAIVVLKLPDREGEPLRLTYFEMINKADWAVQFEKIRKLSDLYNRAYTTIDATAQGGDMAMQNLVRYFGFTEEEDLHGFKFSQSSKEQLINQLQDTVQRRSVVFPYIQTLVTQLQYYQREDKKLETDAVMGLALAVEAAKLSMGSDAFESIVAPDVPLMMLHRNRFLQHPFPQPLEDLTDIPDFVLL